MTSSPEDRDPWNHPEEASTQPPAPAEVSQPGSWAPPTVPPPGDGAYAPWASAPAQTPLPLAELPHTQLPTTDPPNFAQFQPPPPPPSRIPNFGDLCILGLLLGVGTLCMGIIVLLAFNRHFLGIATREQAANNIVYALGSEALLYVFTLLACLIVFPLIWHKGFFAGVQWNFRTALRLRWRLFSAAGACFLLAFLDSVLVPGPSNAPIDKIFREPGAAWLLFGFGITFAPFFEEMFFRGFLLPALCTAYDWIGERRHNRPRLPLDENGHPQWTMPAMMVGAILTSIPFAALHAQQTGYAWGPFVLLVCVSIVLCAIRLSTRSLACSTLVHSSYNFMLFVIMLIGTHGFKHLGKM